MTKTHYVRTTERTTHHNNCDPQAYITTRKNRVKVYDHDPEDTIYLQDNQLFEIELFNPKSVRVLAKIYINNKLINPAGFVVKPGQRVYLERFIDEDRAFTFKTYEVENTSEVKKAIKDNGLIKVEFFEEDFPEVWRYVTYGEDIDKNFIYVPPRNTWPWHNPDYTWDIMTTSTIGVGGQGAFDVCSQPGAEYSHKPSNDTIETGDIEKGNSTGQQFDTTYGSFKTWPCTTITYKILPVSTKPMESKDLRTYCVQCGTRLRKNWKFCSNCGTSAAE